MTRIPIPRAAMVLALCCALTGCGRFDEWHSTQRSFEVTEAVDRVEVQGAATRVELTTGPGPVTVRETARYRETPPDTGHAVSGSTLTVTDPGCRKLAGTAGCEVTFAIRVPAGTAVAIGVDVGDVRVRDLAGDLTVRIAVGDIDASALRGPTVLAHTGTGTVRLRFGAVPDSVDARVTVGEVDIRVPGTARYAVECTGHAEVDVDRDASSPHRITASSPLGISVGRA
jgi:hypothetical protein